MGLIRKVRKTQLVATGILAALLLGFPSAANATPDLLVEIDNTVISMHDFSVTSAAITNKSTIEYIAKIVSTSNIQLGKIRSNITTLDKNLTKNWIYLGKVPNYTYPDRDTMHNFDTQVFAWYNFEVNLQKQVVACIKNNKDNSLAKSCVLKVRSINKKAEGLLYSKITKTLTSIEVWRKAAKR
jgi:hypothetical protein